MNTDTRPSEAVWTFVDRFCAALLCILLALLFWPALRNLLSEALK